MSRSFLLAGACLPALCLSLPAAADMAADPASVVEVVGQRQGSPTAPSVDDARKQINKVAGGVDLVTAEEFRDKYALNLKDMLSGTPGVYAQQRFAEEVRISIRGSGLSRSFHMRGLSLLIDGVPVNLADGSTDFQEIDPRQARYVEVFKGGNALRYGAASLGGAINVVTPTGRTASSANSIAIDGGSFGTIRLAGTASAAGETLDGYVSVNGIRSDGYRQQTAQQTARLAGNVGIKLTDSAETRFYLSANHIQQEVPGTVSRASALDTPRLAPAINNQNDYARDINSVRLSNRTSILLGDEAQLDVGGFLNVKSLFHPIFQVVDQDSQDVGSFIRYTDVGQIGGLRHELVVGLQGRYGHVDALQYVNVRGSRGAKTADGDQYAQQAEAYAESRTSLTPNLTLVAGLQWMTAKRELDNNLNPAQDADKSFHALNPKLGLLYQLDGGTQLYANVSRAEEAPTFSELVQAPVPRFVPLASQKAWTAEVGTRGQSGVFTWDIGLYRSWLRDEYLQFTVNPTIPAGTFNADKTIHQGIEAGLDLTIANKLFASGTGSLVFSQTYMLNDFYFDGDAQFGGNDLAGAPRHLYQGGLILKDGDAWQVGASVEWAADGAWIDYANSLKAPGYDVWSVNGSVQLAKGLRAYAEARNIFKTRYISSISTIANARATGANLNVYYPGEGRSLYAGLKAEF
ncbi:TonB-dependent receptor family protein [Niveispirillum cyanobacteriorum]|nr:TonB-dependent receptor [Niveispirillum cyanobacteriorum]GGE59813.1 TonB-dependent receptor [Niveispirillum cyanobacteriorum]